MEQYIDKSALVAEIEKRMQELHPTNTHQMQVGEKTSRDVLMWLNALTWVLEIIDTLEVKEVDLEKEIDEVIHNYKLNNHKHTSICSVDIDWIAEHFFELGIKVQTNIKMPNLEDIFIENGIDPNSKQAKIFKESYYTALEKLKAQKGE